MPRPTLLALLPLLATIALGVPACEAEAPQPADAIGPDAPPADDPAGLTGSASRAGRDPANENAPTVVVLGDSLAAGLHLPAEEAFPARLEEALAAAGTPVRVVNAGISGDTTAGGLRRLDWILRQDPDVLVVELGANDGLRGVPLAEVESNLRAILERARAAGAQVLLLGIDLPPSYGAYGEAFSELYARLAEELEVAFVPRFLAGVLDRHDLLLADGLHPSAAGQRHLARKLAEPLTRLLTSLEPVATEERE